MRLVNAFFALLLSAGSFVLPVTDASISPAAQATINDTGVSAMIVPAASGVLTPADDLSVTVTVMNRTTSPVGTGMISIYLNRTVVTSQPQLTSWLNPLQVSAGDRLGTEIGQAPFATVAPGQTQSISIVIPKASLGLNLYSTWGPRMIAARLWVAGAQVGQARNSIVWYPGTVLKPTHIAVAVPLTVAPNATGLLTSETLASYTSPTGTLTRQLDAIANQPVAVGIDPMLIASIRLLGISAPPSATAWLARLAGISNETFPLGYADSDLAAVSQSGFPSPMKPLGFTMNPALVTATSTPTASPSSSPGGSLVPPLSILDWNYSTTAVAWPAPDTVVATDLAAFKTGGLTSTILSSSNLATGTASYIPAAGAVGGHSVLISDNTVSTLLTTASQAGSDVEWQKAMSELSAAIAVLTRQHPYQSGIVLATIDRGSPPTGPRLGETVAALQQLPWAGKATLSDAISAAPTTFAMINKPEPAARIAAVTSLLKAEQGVTAFSSVLATPTAITGDRRLELLSLLSQTWIQNTADWPGKVATYLNAASTTLSSIKVADSSSINLLANHTSLPVLVSNSLNYPVTVYVHVRALSSLLSITDKRVKLALEPTSQKRALIPVQSVANGHVTLEVKLTSSTGVPIGQPTYVNINVQAGWETALTVVIAVILVIVFGFGFWRNIVKRRKSSQQGESDDPTGTDPAGTEQADLNPAEKTGDTGE